MAIFTKILRPSILIILLSFCYLTESQACTDRCTNGGICKSFGNGSSCACPDGFSGARCESRSRYAPLVFLCDSGGSLIYESSADELEFHSLSLPNLRRPVAVGYDYEEDVVLWVEGGDGSLNRAQRNGSGYNTLIVGHDISDIAIHVPSKKIAWINLARTLSGVFDYSTGIQGQTFSGSNFSTVAAHSTGNFYVIDNRQSQAFIQRLDNTFYPVRTVTKSAPTFIRSIALNRQGTQLFIIDDQTQTIESFEEDGDNHVILYRSGNSMPVDIAWYRGVPIWTENVVTNGVVLLNGRRGVSPAWTNIIRFENPTGIHVYHGQSYSKAIGTSCLADEFSCRNLCIPLAWRCDGLSDCADGSDEASCDQTTDSGSLVFVADLEGAAIYEARTDNLEFRQLPFLNIQKPVAVDYDIRSREVYWTDVERGTISAAKMDGSNQRILVQGLQVPDGLFIDGTSETIFWTDTGTQTIEAVQFDGTNRRVLIDNVDMPRAIIVVPVNRKLYWTDWGAFPKIEMSNQDGSSRQVISDTDLGWPNGLTYDKKGSRLIWCDAQLDKIESSDLYGGDRRLLLDVTHGVLHPFGVIAYEGTVMWSDWVLRGVGVLEGDTNGTWPRLYTAIRIIAKPSGFVVAVDPCLNEPCNSGTCHPVNESHYECDCMTGFIGKHCDTVDPCSTDPCVFGTCHRLNESDYECDCPYGYVGKNCDTVDPCSTGPCVFGTCHRLSEFIYECNCLYGYVGKNCDTEVTCELPREPENSHIENPKEEYSPGEIIRIKCDDVGDKSISWMCNATSGEWDATADLKCSDVPTESARSSTMIISITIPSAIVIGIGLVVTAVGVYKCMKKKNPPSPSNGNNPQQQDRGPLPDRPPDYADCDPYYTTLSDPNGAAGHIYMTSVVENKAQALQVHLQNQEEEQRYASHINPTFRM